MAQYDKEMNQVLFIIILLKTTALFPPDMTDGGGTFCPCKLNCEKGWTEVCKCETFTCICECVRDKASSGPVLPAITSIQLSNLQKIEVYLRNGNADEILLANRIREIQDAILERNIELYSNAGDKAENQYSLLPKERRAQIDSWIISNLK